jgi:hypothetical protein
VTVKESKILDVTGTNVRVVRGSEVLIIEKDLIINVAGNKLIQVGRPPEQDDKEREKREIPQDATPYARFQALANIPMFDDASAQRATAVSRAKLAFLSDQLQGDDYAASQRLVGRAAEIDNKLEAIAGACHLLSNEIAALPDRMREAQGSTKPLRDARSRAETVFADATELQKRIEETLAENAEPSGGLAKIQQALVTHVGPRQERAAALGARIAVYRELLEEPEELLTARAEGGGGATSGKFEPANVSFKNFLNEDKTAGAPKGEGHKLHIDGAGEIEATQGFKIKCGSSVIEITPGSIFIKSATVKVEGTPINLNG